MIVAIGLAIVLFGLSGLLHARAMAFTMNYTNRHNLVGTRGLLVALYILATAHVVEAGIFAVGFLLAEWAGLGGFVQDDVDTVMEVFYFSLVNYTSLGLGDIYPIGHLRFLAGIESLHGFLLISCSASMLFLVTTRQNQ